MLEMRKDVINFESSNEEDTISAYFYTHETIKPKAILQISHGMCEYIERYEDFASFMVQNGYAVCGNDHLGHGKSVKENGEKGYFAKKDGRKYVLQDLHRMNTLASKKYPGLPIILLGHSMGSFFARMYAVTYPESITGLIISGTGGANPLGEVGIGLTKLISKVKGPNYRSKLVNNLAFGTYLSKIDAPKTQYDWITSDEEIVDAYSKDADCTFIFTVSAFHELMQILKTVNKPSWALKLPKKLPIFLFAGTMDPVGNYGKGVTQVYEMIKDAGVEDVSVKLYENGRHEMLNETNRKDVYEEVLAWCEAHQAV